MKLSLFKTESLANIALLTNRSLGIFLLPEIVGLGPFGMLALMTAIFSISQTPLSAPLRLYIQNTVSPDQNRGSLYTLFLIFNLIPIAIILFMPWYSSQWFWFLTLFSIGQTASFVNTYQFALLESQSKSKALFNVKFGQHVLCIVATLLTINITQNIYFILLVWSISHSFFGILIFQITADAGFREHAKKPNLNTIKNYLSFSIPFYKTNFINRLVGAFVPLMIEYKWSLEILGSLTRILALCDFGTKLFGSAFLLKFTLDKSHIDNKIKLYITPLLILIMLCFTNLLGVGAIVFNIDLFNYNGLEYISSLTLSEVLIGSFYSSSLFMCSYAIMAYTRVGMAGLHTIFAMIRLGLTLVSLFMSLIFSMIDPFPLYFLLAISNLGALWLISLTNHNFR